MQYELIEKNIIEEVCELIQTANRLSNSPNDMAKPMLEKAHELLKNNKTACNLNPTELTELLEKTK